MCGGNTTAVVAVGYQHHEFLSFMTVNTVTELHSLVLSNDAESMEHFLSGLTETDRTMTLETLVRGQTALTLAVTLGQLDSIKVLLHHGASTTQFNAKGWNAYHEAISYGNRDLIELIYNAKQIEESKLWKSKFDSIIQDRVPDFTFQLDFSITSYIPFVTRFLPSASFRYYKKGTMIRIDKIVKGEIVLSFLTIGDQKSIAIDYREKAYCQVWPHQNPKLRMQEEIQRDMCSKNRSNTDLVWKQCTIERAQSGFFQKSDRSDTVDGIETTVWDVRNVTMVSTVRTEHLIGKAKAQSEKEFAEFKKNLLAGKTAEIARLQAETLNPPPAPEMSIADYFSETEYVHLGRKVQEQHDKMTFRAKLWMQDADRSALNIADIVPIMELYGFAEEGLTLLKELLRDHLPAGFPVKAEIPILYFPLTAVMNFVHIDAKCTKDDDWFTVPDSLENKDFKFSFGIGPGDTQ
jgi:hypothetical protein